MSYVYTYSVGKVSSGTNINLAMKFTAEEVGEAVKRIKPYVSCQTELEIVKRSEELERIAKDKPRKIKKSDCVLIDANGNRLGSRNAIAGV